MARFSAGDTLVVLGAGATRGAKWSDETFSPECAPPLNADFLTQLQRIQTKHATLAREVVQDIVELFGPNFSLTLEGYFTQLEFLAQAVDLGPKSGAAITRTELRKKTDRLQAAVAAVLEVSTDAAIRSAGGCLLHERLAEVLRPKDVIISFNYDCVMDHALRSVAATKWSARYGYCFARPSRVRGYENWDADQAPSDSVSTIRLIKLHGSLNWQLPSTVDGEITLKQRLHSQNGVPRFSIVPPVWNKAVDQSPAFLELWRRAETSIRGAKHIAIVGFSFTPTDLHVESLFRVALANSRLDSLIIANPSKPDRFRIREVFSKPLDRGALVRQYEDFGEFVDALPGALA